jgi:serine/threonine protein kinase
MPFARINLSEILPHLLLPLRLRALSQVLEGVNALHLVGFIHRDIKPSNIGVVSFTSESIHIVILDVGSSVQQDTCYPDPGHVGTIPYLAPEMESDNYDRSVDLWACGVVGLQIFATKGRLPWRHVLRNKERFQAGKQAYDQQVTVLRSAAPDSVENLLLVLLAWETSERGTAQEALQHKCFADLKQAALPEGKKRSRSR